MNYGVTPDYGGKGKESVAKEYLGQNRRANMGRNMINQQKYMDKMSTSLN